MFFPKINWFTLKGLVRMAKARESRSAVIEVTADKVDNLEAAAWKKAATIFSSSFTGQYQVFPRGGADEDAWGDWSASFDVYWEVEIDVS